MKKVATLLSGLTYQASHGFLCGSSIEEETDAQVDVARGVLSVCIDDRKIIDTNRLWCPTPSKIVKKMKALLAE